MRIFSLLASSLPSSMPTSFPEKARAVERKKHTHTLQITSLLQNVHEMYKVLRSGQCGIPFLRPH